MMTRLSTFLKDESGAVTVEWVVLTASVAAMGLVIYTVVTPKVRDLTNEIVDLIDEATEILENDG